jgi:hypothetical protein
MEFISNGGTTILTSSAKITEVCFSRTFPPVNRANYAVFLCVASFTDCLTQRIWVFPRAFTLFIFQVVNLKDDILRSRAVASAALLAVKLNDLGPEFTPFICGVGIGHGLPPRDSIYE